MEDSFFLPKLVQLDCEVLVHISAFKIRDGSEGVSALDNWIFVSKDNSENWDYGRIFDQRKHHWLTRSVKWGGDVMLCQDEMKSSQMNEN